MSRIVITDASFEDLPHLVSLDLATWRAAYEGILTEEELNVPTYNVRERQWRREFRIQDKEWFCVVVKDDSELVGFAVGRTSQYSKFEGELHKIYLLKEYQRSGLGSTLFGLVVRHFLRREMYSMWVHSDTRIPSGRFFEAMGGERLEPESGNYGWRDLEAVREALIKRGVAYLD
jgi:GNAT superfamily N-acetyltransferase